MIKSKGQTIQWLKVKNRQHNDQKKKQKRTDNTMTKRKIRKEQTTQ